MVQQLARHSPDREMASVCQYGGTGRYSKCHRLHFKDVELRAPKSFLGSQLAARAISILLAMSVHEDRVDWGCVSVHFDGGFLVECSNLARRIPSMVSVCSQCNLANETQEHVLYMCSFSWRV